MINETQVWRTAAVVLLSACASALMVHASEPGDSGAMRPLPVASASEGLRYAAPHANADLIAKHVTEQAGAAWVPVALQIVKVESSFNCRATGARLREGDHAIGLGQLRLASAQRLGYRGAAAGLRDCEVNARWTAAHMADCIRRGSVTHADLAWCHVSGNPRRGAGRRMGAQAFAYAQRYVKMVTRAPVMRAASAPIGPWGILQGSF